MGTKHRPELSIVIPCYNQGHFLNEAINSITAKEITGVEIIVIDDGSTDNTRETALARGNVHYYFQENKGLPSARNAGLEKCRGHYVIFLDADDTLVPEGVSHNLDIIKNNNRIAFISGAHSKWKPGGEMTPHYIEVKKDHYQHMLLTNYIGNPSCVIYRRAVLERHPFVADKAIKGCEDYENYLTITRRHEVLHNDTLMSLYRHHEGNMSNYIAMMLNSALNVLERQKPFLQTAYDKKCYLQGRENWMKLYSYFPIKNSGRFCFSGDHLELLKKYGWRLPYLLVKKLATHFR